MKKPTSASYSPSTLKPYLSPLAVWALSVGSAIGWGSLVVTSKTYLTLAGPMGSILGLLVGLAMMLMVASHYHYLANRYPGTGGLYNYVKYIFGYDRAFLVAWFLFLVYIAIFWANATSIPLFARYFLRGMFSFGYLYTIFGYEVYLGEALITLLVIVLVAALCIKSKTATAHCIEVLVLLFTAGITVCFIAAMLGHGSAGKTMEPAFVPDKSAIHQVVRIVFISPWAFIGFESVSHSAAEYRFKHKNMFRVLAISLVVTTALYIFIILMSVSAYPADCSVWMDYIFHLDQYDGIEGLPAFYAAYSYLGNTGVYILMASLLALVLTSLIGTLRAVSRLCYAVAQDGILPERYAVLSDKQIPVNTILLIVIDEIHHYMDGTADENMLSMDEESFLEFQREQLHNADNLSVLVIAGLFILSLGVMLVNYSSMKKWEKKTADERDHARTVAYTDPLTGVKSKHAFSIQEGVMETQIADGEAEAFGIIVCDVNGLKHINDTLGHKAGDEYIRSACNLICEYYKHSPVYRVGGDEFVILVQGRDYEARHDILRDINTKIEENLKSGQVVASLGMAEYVPGSVESFHEVFKRADGLMYERKMQLKSMGAKTRD